MEVGMFGSANRFSICDIKSMRAAASTPVQLNAGLSITACALSGADFDFREAVFSIFLTALRAGPPFSWGVTSGGPPGGRSLSKDGTRADSAKDFCRLVGGVIRRK